MDRNLVAGTLQSILRQAGVSLNDFANALQGAGTRRSAPADFLNFVM
jgi:hypothetical protein